jgi:hypothetical protein
MWQSIALLLGLLAAYGAYSVYAGYRKNIAAAKHSGLPYVVVRMYSPLGSPDEGLLEQLGK